MKLETIIAFLKSKNWKLTKSNDKFFHFSPPKKLKFEGDFKLEIPKNENTLTFLRYMLIVTKGIAEVYQLDKEKLIALFSKSLEEIKMERAITKGMVSLSK